MNKIKLSKYAKIYGVCYKTAWNWYKNGKIKNIELSPSGRIYVLLDNKNEKGTDKLC